MLKLQKVELLGFKSFADRTEVTFTGNGVTAIVGPNGCGKSNISDAIHWVLGEQSAKTLRSGRMQDVIFNGTPGRKATGLAEVRLTLLDPEAKALAESAAAALPSNSPAADAAISGSAGDDAHSDAFPQSYGAGSNGRSNGTNGAAHSAGAQAQANGNSRGQAHFSTAEAIRQAGVITVTRRLFASGESEYLLNDRVCRLRDIQDLFLGTGLGPDSYAIIEQGRIGQILSAKPYERRALIEEAAGVTKFKAKRKLAWAKLEASRQNLARVNDILDEVTRQVNSLQRQAAKARRHKELSEQVRASLRQILASRYQQKEQEAAQNALELGALRRSVQEQAALLEESERAQQAAYRVAEELEMEMRSASDERGGLQVAIERARGELAGYSQRMLHLEHRCAEAAQELSQLVGRASAVAEERDAAGLQLQQTAAESESLRARVAELELREKQRESGLREGEYRLEQIRQETLETVGECASLRNQVQQIEQYLGQTGLQIHETERLMGELVAAEAAAALRKQNLEAQLGLARQERDSLNGSRAALEEALNSARDQEQRLRTEVEQQRAELAGHRARRRSLEDLLSNHAYSTEAVQRLFEARSASASRDGEGSGFEAVGVLADFLDVEPAYERVIEEFLRDELDYVVVKDWRSAQRGMELLRGGVPGRATFLLEEAVPALAASGNGGGKVHGWGTDEVAEGREGVLRSLSSCVRFTNGFSHVAGALLPKLERSFLVEDAETARALAARHPDLYFLAPEGTCFQGAFVWAGKGGHQGPLALKRELRGLTRMIEEQEAAAASTAEQLSGAASRIAQLQAELQSLTLREQECDRRVSAQEREVAEATSEQARVADRLAYLTQELDRLRREMERARAQWAQDTAAIAQREQRRAALEEEGRSLAAAMAELKASHDAERMAEGALRGQLAALEERQRSLAATLARLDHDAQQIARREAELRSQSETWQAERAQIAEQCHRLETEIAAAEQRLEERTRRIAELQAAGEQQRQRLSELEQELQRSRQELEIAREKRSASEVQLAKLQSEIDYLKETSRNDLQTEIEAVAAEVEVLLTGDELAAAEEDCRQLRRKLESLGPINMMALEEFEECRKRHEFLQKQKQDLVDSINDTTRAIAEIDTVCNQQFHDALEQIGAHFQQTFAQLFGGGQGMLKLTEAEDASEAGIEIIAQPPGKRLQSVLLLSGGEKALAAMALLLAIFRFKPSPFCILDEVDAPLDEANIGRFTQMVREMSRETQFILITHSKRTMSVAEVLYGVTMQEPGVSKIVSVRFQGTAAQAPKERAEQHGAEPALAEAVA